MMYVTIQPRVPFRVKILHLTQILTSYGDLHSHVYQYKKCKEVHFSEPKYLPEVTTFTRPLLAYGLSDLSEAVYNT